MPIDLACNVCKGRTGCNLDAQYSQLSHLSGDKEQATPDDSSDT